MCIDLNRPVSRLNARPFAGAKHILKQFLNDYRRGGLTVVDRAARRLPLRFAACGEAALAVPA